MIISSFHYRYHVHPYFFLQRGAIQAIQCCVVLARPKKPSLLCHFWVWKQFVWIPLCRACCLQVISSICWRFVATLILSLSSLDCVVWFIVWWQFDSSVVNATPFCSMSILFFLVSMCNVQWPSPPAAHRLQSNLSNISVFSHAQRQTLRNPIICFLETWKHRITKEIHMWLSWQIALRNPICTIGGISGYRSSQPP